MGGKDITMIGMVYREDRLLQIEALRLVVAVYGNTYNPSESVKYKRGYLYAKNQTVLVLCKRFMRRLYLDTVDHSDLEIIEVENILEISQCDENWANPVKVYAKYPKDKEIHMASIPQQNYQGVTGFD